MTMASTILAPIMTPLLTLWLAGQWIDIPAGKMMISIAQVVIAPILLGLLINTSLSVLSKRRSRFSRSSP